MSFGVGAYKLVEPGNALAWGGGIHGNPASGPHPTGISLVLEKGGASEQEWTSDASKKRHNYQMKAADSESNAKNCRASPKQ